MSYSIVRTCRRCGCRSERDVLNADQALAFLHALLHYFSTKGSDDGCPECSPELVSSDPIDRELWRLSVERARGRGIQ